MFDTRKFGGYLSRLRKRADMTQSELSDRLNLTRQSISKYELGDSFPDISVLVKIAEVFDVSLDELIRSGEPTKGESLILHRVAAGEPERVSGNVTELVNLAPLLKPSILTKLAEQLAEQEIDISNVVKLAAYLNDESVLTLLRHTTYGTIDDTLLERLIPLLDDRSKRTIFEKILNGEMDWHLIHVLIPYAEYMISPIEAAVIEGALPWEALEMVREGTRVIHEKWLREIEDWK